ncbi:MAG: IS200/IS605 family transposase, partial [Anaerolineae bacterium]|nr:IS200/IS605 family transposase [Anaerolineae bacterium]
MPFWRTYYHLVWSTKHRLPMITPELEPILYTYMRGKAVELGFILYEINGMPDHIHLIAAIPPKSTPSEIIKRLKGASSYYVNQHVQLEHPFEWQRGYGIISLGATQLQRAINYVSVQKKHHQEQTTNSWLEWAVQENQGPVDMGGKEQKGQHKTYERQPAYILQVDNIP